MKLRSTIICLLASMLFLFTVVPAQALIIWGSDASGELTGRRTSVDSPPGGVDATQQWDNGDFTIGWNIEKDPTTSYWTYTYTVTGKTNGLSHFILEVTDDGKPFNIYDGTDALYEGPNEWSLSTSNPLMPNPIFGVKFYSGDTELTYTMVTDRAPVYGVFYTIDGKKVKKVAWSNALSDLDYKTKEVDLDWTITDFIVRPDGGGVTHAPEPTTMLLLGSGLIGIAVSGKKRLKKRNG